MKIKKILTVVFLLFIAFGLWRWQMPEVSASGSDYRMTEQYKRGRFYNNLKKVSLSGNGAVDTVAVALSQVGYHEGDGEDDLNGENPEGSRDFVEYNVMFGKFDNGQGNGISYGYSWCASFVSWCLRQAGVDEDLSGGDSFISCWRWMSAFAEKNALKRPDAYIPKLGDIIFFKDVDDPAVEVDASHVGIVIFSDGETVYTVEGNTNSKRGFEASGDNVAVKSYTVDSKYIVGYGIPSYEANEKEALLGWQDTADLSSVKPLGELFDAIREGAFVRPVWGDRLYTVEFWDDEGNLLSRIVGEKGLEFTLPEPPSIEGHVFIGWGSERIPTKLENDARYVAVMRDVTPFGRFLEIAHLAVGLPLSLSFLILGVVMLTLIYTKKPVKKSDGGEEHEKPDESVGDDPRSFEAEEESEKLETK